MTDRRDDFRHFCRVHKIDRRRAGLVNLDDPVLEYVLVGMIEKAEKFDGLLPELFDYLRAGPPLTDPEQFRAILHAALAAYEQEGKDGRPLFTGKARGAPRGGNNRGKPSGRRRIKRDGA